MAQLYICSLPHAGASGAPHECFYSDDEAGRARAKLFAEQENRPGRGVYDCIGKLQDGTRSRSKATVAELDMVVCDLDLKHIVQPRDEVIKVLQGLLLRPSEIRDSGFGLHAVWHFKEAADDTAGLEQAERIMTRLAALLAGDPAPTHRAALLRHPGSDNFKSGEPRKCYAIEQSDRQYDISEFEDMFDLYSDRPLLTLKDRPATNGHDTAANIGGEYKAPVDIDARIDAMQWHGAGDRAINITTLHVMASQLRRGVSLREAADVMLAAIRRCVAGEPEAASIDWRHQELEVLMSGARLINKDHTLTDRLPDDLRTKFEELDRGGQRPIIGKNNYKLYVRSTVRTASSTPDAEGSGEQSDASGTDKKERRNKYQIKRPQLEDVALGWWTPLDPAKLPPREWIYGKHYQRGVVSGTIAPGGSGKTSQCMVEAIAMATARSLLGEQPGEQCRVWYHNAEDTQDEVDRRVVAICQHYKIPQEELAGRFVATSCEKFELQVADGMNNLRIKHEVADAIAEKIHQLEVDVAIFDPLVNVHSVDESDNTKMAAVIGVFRAIAQAENCSIEIEQHTRKMPVGVTSEYSGADARGASAVRDALRAQRVLNNMGKEDASHHAIPEHERGLYFRVDVGKLNNARPRLPIWRRIVNVDLANGDQVGVVEEWKPADNGDENPEVRARQQVAENMFLALLDQFVLRNQIVSDKPRGPYYAPKLFAEEDEAKQARLSLADFKAAMARLLKARRIKFADATTRSDRSQRKIERA